MIALFSHLRLLRYAGLFTWACVGIPLVLNAWYFSEGIPSENLMAWRVAWFTFGICYWLLTSRLGRGGGQTLNLLLLATLTTCAIAVSYFSNTGLAGGLLLVIAGLLPWQLGVRLGLAWMLLQHLALVPVFASWEEFSLIEALLQALFYIGYSTVAFVTGLVARQQAQAREEQRRLNAELRATRALLAESTRLTERMRISRELHDLLGHHLTALSLNLEVATHLSEGKVREQVQQAHLLAKLLLTDVREAVSQLRDDDEVDLRESLGELVRGVPAPQIHLNMPPHLPGGDPVRAQVILRCAQEIITNAVRHAGADNLWLDLENERDGIRIRARDDGSGSTGFRPGNGLSGMRERLKEFGGDLTVNTKPGVGFALDAFLPLEHPK
jgi:signal transduction histidine kinase